MSYVTFNEKVLINKDIICDITIWVMSPYVTFVVRTLILSH